jgi:hypothetical protein
MLLSACRFASPSDKGEACIRNLFNFDFKDVGAAVVGEM